jgi:hypothetical protein
MRSRSKERFKELCEQAEVQDDSGKLAELADEIAEILETEIEKLKKREPKTA